MSDDQPTIFGQFNAPDAQPSPPAPTSSSEHTPIPSPATAPIVNHVQISQSPLAPPTTPGPIQRPYRKVIWPEFLGSISLALGIMGVIMSLTVVIPRYFMGSDRYLRSWGFGVQMQASVVKNQFFHDLATGLYFLAAIGLCIIGVQFISRSPKVRTSIKWWIPLRIIVSIMYGFITIELNNVNLSSLQAAGAIQVQPARIMTWSTYLSTSMIFVWWLTFPAIFTYILMSEKMRSEMARWTLRGSSKNSLKPSPPPPPPLTPVQ